MSSPAHDQRRILSLRLTITDQRGSVAAYTVRPLPAAAGIVRAYALTKLPPAEYARYVCRLLDGGRAECECKGFASHQRCKHVDALDTAGLLPRETVLRLRARELEVEGREALARPAVRPPNAPPPCPGIGC